MKNYTYQNELIGKKQLRELLAWSFTNYDSIQACFLADELKYLGFQYATQAGISISVEDLKIPFVKNQMIERANREIIDGEKIYLKGKITDIERFQKIIDTWSLTSESLKDQIIYFFKNYDPLNSVYIMAFSGARGNLSQVRQLVGMRGLMSDPSGEIMPLPIKKNFREGLSVTDYLMSGYGARKGIVDTALKTANSGYLTRRLIDVAQDILIREKDCLTNHSFLVSFSKNNLKQNTIKYEKIIGRILNKSIIDPETGHLIAKLNTQINYSLIEKFKNFSINKIYVRSPLTCNLYRAICQKCYGWNLAHENIVDIGEAVGILAGQSIGEPGTQLTMRTFHTGGIFTAKGRERIISPVNGIIKFCQTLKTITLRTNRGEDVLVTKNSGLIILIPDNNQNNLTKIEISKNTILFSKNNQYILKDMVIGELININKQIKTEVKPILSNNCGEVFIPTFKQRINTTSNNKLIWILSGQLYYSPNSSFINFYRDYKLNKHSFIFRSKILNHYSGIIQFLNYKQNLYEQILELNNVKYSFINSYIKKFSKIINNKNYLLIIDNLKYLVKLEYQNFKVYLQLTKSKQFGLLLTNSFQTLSGGIIYYNYHNLLKLNKINQNILYQKCLNPKNRYKPSSRYKTILWLEEEIHKINCEQNILLVDHGDFISEGLEIIPGLCAKTSGLVTIQQKNNIIQTISIKSGLVYKGQKFKDIAKKLYYPGEIIFSNIYIKNLSFCEHLISKKNEYLLLRPIKLYEFSNSISDLILKQNKENSNTNFKLESNFSYNYKPGQRLEGTRNLNLINNYLSFANNNNHLNDQIKIECFENQMNKSVDLNINNKLQFNNHITSSLKYKNLHFSYLVQKNQFIDQYTLLGYLEIITLNSLEIVKFKVKKKDNKQILLISNKDCLTVPKNKFAKNKLNDFILGSSNVSETGKVIIENKKFLTLQKGKPYFFPNCRNNNLTHKTNVQYKIISPIRIKKPFGLSRLLHLNYSNRLKFTVQKVVNSKNLINRQIISKSEFAKLFFKKDGKLYSSLIPQFFKEFSVCNKSCQPKLSPILHPKKTYFLNRKQTLLIKSEDMIENKSRNFNNSKYQLSLLKFVEHSLIKSAKSIGIYSITEDFFEQDVNSVFCKNTEFIENGQTIGLLNLEKEITGDIVQGLPRIEEILEARKKNLTVKRIPNSKKKGLLTQKTSLDPNFEFRKLATPIQENEKINPYKLLKVYFNYYGSDKSFLCDYNKTIHYNRLFSNYEGSYKSFKKVQSFILESVQIVYKSQGVKINDKHLEIIIKQMTTKVLITYEGNTPLLRHEIIDLYHIEYINQTITNKKKQPAYYVPLLLGITKAALNNPSFISAASFQETTKVLTKAAIEGTIDWLRGLKENIIIGHLIPAGTGSQNYRHSFKSAVLINNH